MGRTAAQTPAEFAAKLLFFRPDLLAASKSAVSAVAFELKKEYNFHFESGRMRGSIKKRGGPGERAGARYSKPQEHDGSVDVLAWAFGPVQRVEWPTKPHRIPKGPFEVTYLKSNAKLNLFGKQSPLHAMQSAGKAATKTKARRRFVKIPGRGVFDHVNHPGTTTGKGWWQKAVNHTEDRSGRVMAEWLYKAMRKQFGN